jgi:CRISPR-associated protein Csm2
MALVSDTDLQAIIQDGNNEVMVTQSEAVGKALARQLTSSQIRGIFGSVRRIELDWQSGEEEMTARESERLRRAQREFALLQPRLAYQAKRERGQGVENLCAVLTPAMQLVGTDHTRFRNFVDFFEAILAYHKAAGGQ